MKYQNLYDEIYNKLLVKKECLLKLFLISFFKCKPNHQSTLITTNGNNEVLSSRALQKII